MLALDWSDEARHDLAEIQDYVEQFNPIAALSLRNFLETSAERLPSMPYAFRTGRVAGTREYPAHPNYLLVYKVDSAKVRILRVMHAKRKYP
ncbi:addiction module antitoxin [Ventosimonas gracilis]|uniref:Addiction module antitoxin n=1 Tax=Ventosimonas gracilis TaxID=1680762 RepID=A0A139SM05_9GAMM|nr:type II toxin-antitoxin system RelE/ParE family toxin [Ventosimonas gracilis]KXU35589.1 addiction module antitoxin [Ventosimonas gracilis]